MARVNPFALYPPSFEEALREVLAVGPPASKAGHEKRQPTTRKAKKAKAKKKRKKK